MSLSQHLFRASLAALPRLTKDLDFFNVSRLDERLRQSLRAHLITPLPNLKPPTRFKINHPAPVPGRHDAVKINSAVRTDTKSLLRYTTKIDGITVATIPPLLAEKILASAERPLMKGGKVSILDILLRYRMTQGMGREFLGRSGFQDVHSEQRDVDV